MALVILSDVKRHLGVPESETAYDTELQTFISAATPIIEHIVGPVEQRNVTETHEVMGKRSIVLRVVPVVSVTTVTEYLGTQAHVLTAQPPGSVTNNQYGYYVSNLDAGLLQRRVNGYSTHFMGNELVVTYIAGRTGIPDNIKLAVLDDIRATWSQTQTAARPQFGGGGVVMGPDGWTQDLHMFPRLAAMLEGERFIEGIA